MKKLFPFLLCGVMVTSFSACNSNNSGQKEYVDLDLPSGTLWATCNVGATNPEDYGDYFAWGETTTKDFNHYYTWTHYKYSNGSYDDLTKYSTHSFSKSNYDNQNTLDVDDDAARVNWGGKWRMPTKTQFEELLTECVWTQTEIDGVKGYVVTSTQNTSRSIFFPMAGSCYAYGYDSPFGKKGSYWSLSLREEYAADAYHLYINDDYKYGLSHEARHHGQSVRPVCLAPSTSYTISIEADTTKGSVTGAGVYQKSDIVTLTATANEDYVFIGWNDGNPYNPRTFLAKEDITLIALFEDSDIGVDTYRYVDLNLPSGTLWATCNVGATNPEDYGDYFAWGETTTKSNYSSSNYTYFGHHPTTLPQTNDAANANWGGTWRMPTKAELYELRTECTWKWTSLNGVNGYRVIGKNGNFIFLPAAGWHGEERIFDTGYCGYYLSSSIYDAEPSFDASSLFFNSTEHNGNHRRRASGLSVRPVCSSQ